MAKGLNVDPEKVGGFAGQVKEAAVKFKEDLDGLIPVDPGAAPTALPGSPDFYKNMGVMGRGLHDWGGGLEGTYFHNAYFALGAKTTFADFDESQAAQLKAALTKVDDGVPAAPAGPAGGRPPAGGPANQT